ncbi:hypothetical protein [Winogradskyella thalassocola]|uniref:HNH endonuclease n=1 Tax=Winogradskyella thalassocola TaxID=262004 RepID=A0A1G7ZNR3_9FLAO|nr:hypothetical protein [Winogradskyella thalassocola]SDH10196.1 hypothetical protein SAMN04489796_1011388 [Winogradskyella thalassocola]
MIYIDDGKQNIIKAKNRHNKVVSEYISRYHLKPNTDINRFIKNNLDRLINGTPDELFFLNKNFYDGLRHYSYNEYLIYLNAPKIGGTAIEIAKKKKYYRLHKRVEKKINYSNWFITSKKHYDYALAENLNIPSCTYCNRIYTNTMKTEKGKKVMRPQFDHWFPKSKFPILALSFYNLIPSCSVCNSSAKSDTIFYLDKHLHPYVDSDVSDRFNFSYDYFKSLDKYNVKISHRYGDTKAFKTFSDMNLETMFNAHISELQDLISIKKAYSKSYILNMINAYPKANLSYDGVYRLAFGTEFKEEDFYKRPFSKFKKDILTELKLI